MPKVVPLLSNRLQQIRRCFSEPVVISKQRHYDYFLSKAFTEERLEQYLRWTRLSTLLDRWTEQGVILAAELDEARGLLTSIPADIRTAPASWYMVIRQDEWYDDRAGWDFRRDRITALLDPPHPAWSLVGSIVLTQEFATTELQQAFCSAPIMGQIEGLFMFRQPDYAALDNTFVTALLGSGAWTNLRHFSSSFHRLSGRTLEEFAAWPGLDHLVSLTIFEATIAASSVKQFITSPRLLALERLALLDCKLGDDAATVLASAQRLSRLAQLDLRFNKFTDVGKAALTNAPALQGVKVLL